MITQQPVLDVKRYWLPALIGAIGAVAGSALGWGSQSSANSANKDLAKYKYDKDLEMWNRQNNYNTPSAQMQRYAQAGINPNIIASQGNAGNATGMPEYSAPDMKAYNGWDDLGASAVSQAIIQKYQLDNQTRSTDSQVSTNKALQSKYNAEARNTIMKTETEYWQSIIKAKEAGILDEFGAKEAAERLKQLQKQNEEIDSRIDLNNSHIELNDSVIAVNNQKIENLKQDIQESLSRIGVNKARIGEITQNTALLGQKILESGLTQKQLQYILDTNPDPDITKYWNEQQNEINVMYKKLQMELQDASAGQTSPLMYLLVQLSRLGR